MVDDPEKDEDDTNFDDEFMRLSQLGEDDDAPAAGAADDDKGAADDDKGAADDDKGAADDTVAAGEDDDTVAAGEDDDAVAAGEDDDTVAAGEDDDTVSGESDDDILSRFARIVSDQADAKKPDLEAEPAATTEDEPAIYTPEEQETLEAYQKDWPEVAKAESLVRRAEYRAMLTYVFDQVGKELQPMMETVATLSERTQLTDLRSNITDYDTVRDDVVTWVDTQPSYLQDAYKRVMQSGTVDEVSDLVQRYRKDTGVVVGTTSTTEKKGTELPTTTKKAAASLAPVSSKRSVVPADDDVEEDYDSAFAKYASTG